MPANNNTAVLLPRPTLNDLTNLVADGKFFTVAFLKRTTGERRVMTARVGVTKHLRGTGKSHAAANNLLSVWSVRDRGYRSIPVEGVISVTAAGQKRYFIDLLEFGQ